MPRALFPLPGTYPSETHNRIVTTELDTQSTRPEYWLNWEPVSPRGGRREKSERSTVVGVVKCPHKAKLKKLPAQTGRS